MLLNCAWVWIYPWSMEKYLPVATASNKNDHLFPSSFQLPMARCKVNKKCHSKEWTMENISPSMVEVCKLEWLGLMQVRRGTVSLCVMSHKVFKKKNQLLQTARISILPILHYVLNLLTQWSLSPGGLGK